MQKKGAVSSSSSDISQPAPRENKNHNTSASVGSQQSTVSDSFSSERQEQKEQQIQQQQHVIYQRILLRKQNMSSEAALQRVSRASKGFHIIGIFSKESTEERHIRVKLKGYKTFLNTELQQLKRATVLHKRRVLDQAREFEEHEVKLSIWGLKFIVPFYRMQAWSRLSRSALLRDLADSVEQLVSERLHKATIYLQHFEESINRTQKYSLSGVEEFCKTPESLLQQDVSLIAMTRRLHSLDQICSSTTRKFLQFEPEYSWNDHARRRRILMRILKRYRSIPSASPALLSSIENSLNWEAFCNWLANRTKMVSALEAEFSDFVEDQREKEGRLFYRWHQSLYCGSSPSDVDSVEGKRLFGDGADESEAAAGRGAAETHNGDASDSPSQTAAAASSSSSSSKAAAAAAAIAAAAAAGVDDGGSGEKARKSQHQRSATGRSGSGAELPNPMLSVDGIVALKATPWSIRNFIRYFANDVIGIQYNIPRDYEEANLALTEALFFR